MFDTILALSLLLFLSKLIGNIFNRIKQPAILGELTAGILLGIHVLGPFLFSEPLHEIEYMQVLSQIGAMFLLFMAGYSHVKIDKLLQVGGRSIAIACVEAPLCFAAGFGIGYLFHYGLIASLFTGLALSITGIGVTVRILMDLNRLQTDYGMNILGIAILDATFGLFFLSFLAAFAHSQEDISLYIMGITILKIGFFFGGALLFSKVVLFPIALLADYMNVAESKVGLILSTLFIFSYVADWVGLHFIIGSFVAGIIIARHSDFTQKEIKNKLNGIAYGLFVPIFFGVMGARIDFGVLKDGGHFAMAFILTGMFAKFLGGTLGAKISGYPLTKALILGTGLIPRAGVGLAMASLALSAGIIDEKIFAAVVGIVTVTVIFTPLVLKYAIQTLEKNREEGVI
ncbi:MAG: cation:proton antiporter [Thermodesulfobacteriota bacterium]|nr:cation:proton antiporter [Thermodesulfobacteriota bacterium]